METTANRVKMLQEMLKTTMRSLSVDCDVEECQHAVHQIA